MVDLRRVFLVVGLLVGCDDGGASGDAGVRVDAPPDIDGGGEVVDAGGADAGPVQLTTGSDFPTEKGTLCGLGVDPDNGDIWVQPCMGGSMIGYLPSGEAIDGIGSLGEAADDVDVTFAPVDFTLREQAVGAGELLFVNGETGVAEIYPHQHQDADELVAGFGASHVVGGGYHVDRGSFFLVQDKQAATDANTVAEIDVVTGALLNKFSTLPGFDVNYGDLEVCPSTGHLFLVSSTEAFVGELSAEGALLAKHPLPAEVTLLSGLGLAGDGEAWVSSTGGQVWRLEGVPCE